MVELLATRYQYNPRISKEKTRAFLKTNSLRRDVVRRLGLGVGRVEIGMCAIMTRCVLSGADR